MNCKRFKVVIILYDRNKRNVLKKGREIMNEVINSILEAEKKAAEIVAKASEESKTRIIKGEETAEREKETAVSAFLDERKRVLSQAESKAQAAYDEILSAGKARAEDLKKSCAERVEDAAKTVIGRIFD